MGLEAENQPTGQSTPTPGEGEQNSGTILYGEDPKPEGEGGEPKPEGKEGDPKPEGEGDEPKPEGKEGEPVEYDLESNLPEGAQVDSDVADGFKAWAQEKGLSQEDVNKLTELQGQLYQKQVEQHQQTINEWAESTKNDPDIGGDKLNENLAVAKKAIDAFGSEELKEVLNNTGLGNHPAVIKFAYAAGQKISDDSFERGGETTPTNEDPASRLFPEMNK